MNRPVCSLDCTGYELLDLESWQRTRSLSKEISEADILGASPTRSFAKDECTK